MKKRIIGVILAAVLLVAVIAAVVIPKMGQAASAGPGGAPLTVVTGVIGSEKKEFFDDPKVKQAFAARGYDVQVKTAGSRQIATSPALASSDFAFPSSAPAAEKIKQGSKTVKGTYPTFYSPMAVATFKPVAQLLKNAGIASQDAAGTWQIDMKAYLAAVAEGKRWNQLPGAAALYNSNRTLLMTSTDIRSSNSAAMYLAIASYTANGNNIVNGPGAEDKVLPQMAGLFLNQGFSESSSGGPFGDYLSQGMGSKPMVMIYESQFFGQQMSETGAKAMTPDMVLMYPQATVLSKHTVIALTDKGNEIGQLLLNDPGLATLAAEHGFRPADRDKLVTALQAHNLPLPEPLVDVTDAPSYEVLESLITKISAKYDPASTPAATADGDAATTKK